MDSSDQPSASPEQLLRSTLIPIAQISPTNIRILESSIHATVTLVWPYSSSNKSLSLSLAEPDFRLRRLKGQVKVVFHGAVAENIAKSHVGIGDEVYLSLAGSRLVNSASAIQTPGRFVGWDLHFDNEVLLEALRSSKHLSTVRVDHSDSLLSPSENDAAPPATPTATRTLPDGPGTVNDSISWGSPAFLQRSRSSFGAVADSAYRPFAEEDGSVPGKGRKRPRFSMRGSEWRVVDEPDSPEENEDAMDWTRLLDDNVSPEPELDGDNMMDKNKAPETVEIADREPNRRSIFETTTPEIPPAVPFNEVDSNYPQAHPDIKQAVKPSTSAFELDQFQAPAAVPQHMQIQQPPNILFHLPTDTPRLHPVPSPGLPIPSPFVSAPSSPHGYFTPRAPTSQPPINQLATAEPNNAPDARLEVPPTQAIKETAVASGALDQMAPLAETSTTNHAFDISHEISTSTTAPETAETQPVGDFESNGAVQIATEYQEHKRSSVSIAEAATAEVEMQKADDADHMDHEVIDVEETEEHVPQSEYSESEDEHDFSEQRHPEEEHIAGEEEVHGEEDEEVNLIRMEEGAEGPESLTRQSRESDEIEDESEGSAVDTSELPRDIAERSAEFADEDSQPESENEPDSYPVGDEEISDEEEPEDEYESEHVYDDEEGDFDESADESDEQNYQPQPQQKIVHPEIIVLDSDSEDEIQRPVSQPHRPEEPQHETVSSEEIESDASSADEESESEEESAGSGADDYDIEEEPSDDEDVEEESEDEQVEDELVAEAGAAVEQFEDEQIEGVQRDLHAVEQEQVQHKRTEADYAGPAMTSATHETVEYPDFEIQVVSAVNEDAQRPGIPTQEVSQTLQEPLVVESIEQSHKAQDMAIDPDLFQLEASAKEAELEADGSRPVDHRLMLDGSSDYAMQYSTTAPKIPDALAQDHQLVTPDASQNVGVNGKFDTGLSVNEIPLTPELTQEAPAPVVDISVGSKQDGIRSVEETSAELVDEKVSIEGYAGEDESLQDAIRDDLTEVSESPFQLIAVPDRHYPGLRSRLSYFAPLATLVDHFNALVDTISVVCETSSVFQAVSGRKDYALSFRLTDQSMAGTTVPVQIFRPYKNAMPSLNEGDAILLRNFKVQSFDHSMMLVSIDTSAWAVFDGSADEAHVTGPPVEYGDEERSHATDLRQWYQETGTAMIADNQLQASIERASREVTPLSIAEHSESGSVESWLDVRGSRRRRRSHRRITIHELRDGRKYTEVGSPSDKESIHELRDGTTYAHP